MKPKPENGYGNTEGSFLQFVKIENNPVETTRCLLYQTMIKAYILGALHDATKRKNTYRICQKSKAYVEFIAQGIRGLGHKAWVYREGQTRDLYVVEFSSRLLADVKISSRAEKIAYIRAYFDTDGGIAKSKQVRYYIYFAQKDLADLQHVKTMLESLGICCGRIHNPSKRVDPNYWRFYIAAKSHFDFACIIGSDHPDKRSYVRMKI